MLWRRKNVVTTSEAGKSISAANMEKVQGIHDMSSDMGADCASPIWASAYESARIWEAALPMSQSHDDLRSQLHDAIRAAHGSTTDYYSSSPYIRDVFPNHVIYSHQGQLLKRPYSVEHDTAAGKSKVSLGTASKKVHVAYVDSSQSEAGAESMIFHTDIPADCEEVTERYISKATRDKADAKDFAGKHRSFPILAPEDVEDALKSIGRAGSDNYDSATLKANILRIAKRKGYAVPASDQESNVVTTLGPDELMVNESIEFCMDVPQFVEFMTVGAKEAAITGKATTIPVKIIGPGQGSMAFYGKEMIAASGPKAFGKGTHMYWNHATESQLQERAEGNLSDLAAVLTEDAQYQENGPKGPGLYSKAKVFSDYATQVQEKGAYIGISINTPIKFTEGMIDGKQTRIAKEFIKSPFTSADFVTRAGAKGAPVVQAQESAGAATTSTVKENNMTPEEIKAMQDENAALKARESARAKADQDAANTEAAFTEASKVLKTAGIRFSDNLLRRACANPTMKEGKVDPEFVKGVVADFTEGITGSITGMGRERATAEFTEAEVKESVDVFADLPGMSKQAAEVAVKGAN